MLVGSTGSADLSDPTLIANAIVTAVKNSAASLPASVVANVDAIAANLAALIAPVIAGNVANVNDSLDSVELSATPSETLASLQKAGSMHAVVDSVQSSASNLLAASISPAALRDTSLSDSLSGLGTAVAEGDEDTITEAAPRWAAMSTATTWATSSAASSTRTSCVSTASASMTRWFRLPARSRCGAARFRA